MNLKKITSLEDARKVCYTLAKRYDNLCRYAFDPQNSIDDRLRAFQLAHHTMHKLNTINTRITKNQFENFHRLLDKQNFQPGTNPPIIGAKPSLIIPKTKGIILPIDHKKKK